jgi:hypothetical protein
MCYFCVFYFLYNTFISFSYSYFYSTFIIFCYKYYLFKQSDSELAAENGRRRRCFASRICQNSHHGLAALPPRTPRATVFRLKFVSPTPYYLSWCGRTAWHFVRGNQKWLLSRSHFARIGSRIPQVLTQPAMMFVRCVEAFHRGHVTLAIQLNLLNWDKNLRYNDIGYNNIRHITI